MRGLIINRIRTITKTIEITIRTIVTIKEVEMQVEVKSKIYQTRE